MVEERVCSSGHVIDSGKENCSRCGGACVNEPEKVVDDEVVNEEKEVDNLENDSENGSTEPENTPENDDVDSNIQEPKVEEESLPLSGLAVA